MRKLVLSLFAVLFCAFQLSAQRQQITGTVTGDDGAPVHGVTVIVAGTAIGTTTDSRGVYSISAPANGSLQFSFLGYEIQEVQIGGRTVIDVILSQSSREIDVVVVTSYGITRTTNSVSGAISTLSGEKIIASPTTSFDEALAGKMAGVHVTTSSGLLADGTSIRIRGTNSVSLSSQPLVVIDGMPINENTNLNIFNDGDGTRFNPMATINQNDIESVEVLKDAAAAALYGSRAANGVILIQTKRGKAGQTRVSYNNYFGWSTGVGIPKLLNATQFVDAMNELGQNAGAGDLSSLDYDANGNLIETDWMKKVYRTGFSQNHSVSVSGGGDKFSFYGSADWIDQEGIVAGNDLSRYSFRSNVEARPTKWLKAGVNVSYSKTKNKGVISDGYLAGVTVASYLAFPNVAEKVNGEYNLLGPSSPYYPYGLGGVLDPGTNQLIANGAWTFGNSVWHPTAILNYNRNANTSDRINTVGFIEVNPVKGLSLTSKIGLDHMNNFEDQYNHPALYGLGSSYNGLVQDNMAWIKQWNWQNYINYNNSINRHTFSLMAGLEYQNYDYKDIFAGAYDFVNSRYQEILDALFAGDPLVGGTRSSKGMASYFANVSYNYDNRYYLDISFRADGHSGFGSDNQYGYFPGASAAWRISEEDFMAGTRNWLSGLKIRASWGIVGNSNINSYASRTLYNGGQYADLNGLSIGRIGKPDLKWETTHKTDVGFDASFLGSRLNVSFDYWRTDISDMLLNAPVPNITGLPNAAVLTNIGKMRNSGIELQINSVNIRKNDVMWSSTFNFTTVKNKVRQLAGDDMLGTTSVIVGKPIGVFRVYEWAGVDSQTGRAGYIDQASGQAKYYDPLTGGYFFADGTAAPTLGTSDLVVQSKTGNPTWYGNFDNTVMWKNFDFTVGFQFSGGNRVLNLTRASLLTTWMANKSTEYLDHWRAPGDQSKLPKMYLGVNTGVTTASTKFLEKADFLRLREVTIGYTIPAALAEKIGFSGRVFVRGNNLLLVTAYKGSDPEISTNRNTNANAGWDQNSVPNARTFTVGLNFNF